MHRVIYVDTLVVMNTVVTYILLLSVQAFRRVETSLLRLVPASFFGGAASLLVLVPTLPFYLTIPFRLAICVLIPFVAFFAGNVRDLLRSVLLFALTTFLYGGVMFFLSQMFSGFVVYQNGFGYVGLNFPGLVLSVSAIYLILRLLKRKYGKRTERFVYGIELAHEGRTAKGTALYDSGHFVTDCYNGQPVIIAGEPLLRRLLTAPEMADLSAMGRFSGDIPSGTTKARYIPVSTVSGERLLPAFTCERVTVSGEETHFTVNHVSLALAGLPEGADGCDALINERLFERR